MNRKSSLARNIIREVIYEWHPLGLATDISDPEFDGEVNAIFKQLNPMNSPRDTAHVISRVFQSSFYNDPQLSRESCTIGFQKKG